MTDQLIELRNKIRQTSPLIHCITNPISINDCANAVLAVGAKPIMAEHPKEVSEITNCAKALAINLGNITDARLESIMISGNIARENNIPCVIDLVGVACSKLRNEFANGFIEACNPSLIKGNITEIKSIYSNHFSSCGVDVLSGDEVTNSNLAENIDFIKKLSKKTKAVIVATGATDIIVNKNNCYAVSNGNNMMSQITGTGCILNALIASFISTGEILAGAVLATTYLGMAGEFAYTELGTGTFRVRLIDALSTITDEEFSSRIKLKEV